MSVPEKINTNCVQCKIPIRIILGDDNYCTACSQKICDLSSEIINERERREQKLFSFTHGLVRN